MDNDSVGYYSGSHVSIKYRMAGKFLGTKCFADWPLAKILQKNFCGSTIKKLCPYRVYANHTHITCESAVMASEFSVEVSLVLK